MGLMLNRLNYKMYFGLKFVLLLYILTISNTQTTSTHGVCKLKPLTCCINYRRNGNQCEECFLGTFGVNCNTSCPDGRYGRLCLENCTCSSCNKISGSCQNSSFLDSLLQEASTSTSKESKSDKDDNWTNILLCAFGITGICVSISIITYYGLRRSRFFKPSNSPENNESQFEVRESNETSVTNPYARKPSPKSYLTQAKKSKDLKPHYSSKYHDRAESPYSKKYLREEELAFKACSTEQEADNLSNTSENVYSHLNIGDSPYNTLNLTSKLNAEPEEEIQLKSLQKWTSIDSKNSIAMHRRSFLYPENSLHTENPSTAEDFENLHRDIQSNIRNSKTLLSL